MGIINGRFCCTNSLLKLTSKKPFKKRANASDRGVFNFSHLIGRSATIPKPNIKLIHSENILPSMIAGSFRFDMTNRASNNKNKMQYTGTIINAFLKSDLFQISLFTFVFS